MLANCGAAAVAADTGALAEPQPKRIKYDSGKHRSCPKTNIRADRCRCGGPSCGSRLCPHTGKSMPTCPCASEKCGSARCPDTNTLRLECRCGRPNCATRICKKTMGHKKYCKCGAVGCGNGYCPDTGRTKCYCKCGHELCGSKLCRSVHCDVIGNPSYDRYCTNCFKNMFPGDPRCARIRQKSRELRVVHHVLAEFGDLGWMHDKPLYVDFTGGCCPSKRRCDLRVLIDATMLVIECDEGQHKGKAYANDDARYDDLFMDFSGKYIFIRFNPDNYRIDGVLHKTPWDERLAALSGEITRQVARIKSDTVSQELVEIVHLYFDVN